MAVRLQVNGKRREVTVDPGTPLLWVLRDSLGLVGTKFGCGVGQCGACTVHVGGEPVRSCSLSVGAVGAREVVTIEGVGGPEAHALFDCWEELDVPQCGYCQPGQVMTATALLRTVPKPSDQEIEAAMVGNLCRCATYLRIKAAIREASRRMEV